MDIQINTLSRFDKVLSGLWRIGDFFIQVGDVRPTLTPEPATLSWLREKDLSFAVPELVYHAQAGGMEIFVKTGIPHDTLTTTWLTLTEDEKNYYIQAVSKIYIELSQFRATYIGGVDGRRSDGLFFCILGKEDEPGQETLIQKCKKMGMKCDSFTFTHLNMHMQNIHIRTDRAARNAIKRAIYEPGIQDLGLDKPLVGVLCWDEAEFVPIEWIMTQAIDGVDNPYFSRIVHDFKRRLWKQSEIDGMPNLVEKFNALREEALALDDSDFQ